MKISSGNAPRGPDQIMVDADTADKHHLKLGDEIAVITAVGTHRAKVSGFAEFQVTNPGAAIFYLDTKTAQEALNTPENHRNPTLCQQDLPGGTSGGAEQVREIADRQLVYLRSNNREPRHQQKLRP